MFRFFRIAQRQLLLMQMFSKGAHHILGQRAWLHFEPVLQSGKLR
jgi:hypothetical protein